MGFVKKTWKDRLSEHPVRRLLTPTDGSTAMEVDVTREEGTIIQPGDAFSAANMNDLEQRIADAVGGGDINLAPVEASSQATNAYVKGDLLIYDGTLYRATTSISVGNSLVEGINITPTTMSEELVGEMSANGNRIYMDYQNGAYGYNTNPNRGADTFHPFSSKTRIATNCSGIENKNWHFFVDCTGFPGYQNLTNDNFLIELENVSGYGLIYDYNSSGQVYPGQNTNHNITHTYNVSTGILDVYCPPIWWSHTNQYHFSFRATVGVWVV